MKKNILLIIKGMIIGLANVIPGVSGGTLMITLGIYEDVINTISHFFSNFKKNLKFIIPLVIGMPVSDIGTDAKSAIIIAITSSNGCI